MIIASVSYFNKVIKMTLIIPPAFITWNSVRRLFSHQLFDYSEVQFIEKGRLSVDFLFPRTVDPRYSWIPYLQIHLLTETSL